MLDLYVVKEGKKLRCGYTTGSSSAAASKACALMLESKEIINSVKIDTPEGIILDIQIFNPIIKDDEVSCYVVKDAGDDPDVTDKIEIYARVRKNKSGKINIDGGRGIGRISEKSFFGRVGDPAINKVPREMIRKELEKVSDSGYDVLIWVPRGEEIAKKTFNKNIGIEGGISIIGTKGIVYPMSDEALLKTIYMEIDSFYKNEGGERLVLVPGNYGEKISREIYPNINPIKISNFLGDSLLYSREKNFREIVLIGHIGKFCKLALGIFNTHSKVADTRIEAFIYYLYRMGASLELIKRVENTLTAEEALNICIEEGYGQIVGLMEKDAEKKIRTYLKDDTLNIRVIIYSMERGISPC